MEQTNMFSGLFNFFFIQSFSCTTIHNNSTFIKRFRFFILICIESTMWNTWVKVGLEELDALQALMENSP